jgi:hypothetical protein
MPPFGTAAMSAGRSWPNRVGSVCGAAGARRLTSQDVDAFPAGTRSGQLPPGVRLLTCCPRMSGRRQRMSPGSSVIPRRRLPGAIFAGRPGATASQRCTRSTSSLEATPVRRTTWAGACACRNPSKYGNLIVAFQRGIGCRRP